MHYWTIAEISALREEVSKGKKGNLKQFAKQIGVDLSAVQSQVQRYRMRALKVSQCSEPGVECEVCGERYYWKDGPDDAVALVMAMKKWKQAHLVCRRAE